MVSALTEILLIIANTEATFRNTNALQTPRMSPLNRPCKSDSQGQSGYLVCNDSEKLIRKFADAIARSSKSSGTAEFLEQKKLCSAIYKLMPLKYTEMSKGFNQQSAIPPKKHLLQK